MREKMSTSKKLSIANVVIDCSFMVLVFIMFVIGSATGSEIIFCSAAIIFGFLALWMCIYDIIRFKRCNTEVIAVLADCTKTIGIKKSSPRYTPVFNYEFDGKIYVQQSFVSYSRRRFHELFVQGRKYTLRIDPQLPTCCVYGSGDFTVDIILLFIAFVFILMSFIAVFF